MRSGFGIWVIWLLVCVLPVTAQGGADDLVFQSGYAVRGDGSTGILSSWDNSSAFFVGVTHPMGESVRLASRVTFRSSDFDRYRGPGEFWIPEYDVGKYRAGALKSAELAVGVQMCVGHQLRMTWSVLPGVVAAWPDSMTRRITDIIHPEVSFIETASGTGELTLAPLLGIGVGVAFPLMGPIDMGISAEGWVSSGDTDLSGSLSWVQVAASLELRHP